MDRTCSTCGQTKPEAGFYERSGSTCRECSLARDREYYAKNREQKLAKGRENYAKNRHRRLAKSRAWRAANPDYNHEYRLRTVYNLSSTQYTNMLESQGSTCAVCRASIARETAQVDHDHSCCAGDSSCGRCVRGLLCASCNRGLAAFHDDLQRLRRAIRYLDR